LPFQSARLRGLPSTSGSSSLRANSAPVMSVKWKVGAELLPVESIAAGEHGSAGQAESEASARRRHGRSGQR
jgi:hypothetical protein